MWHGGVNGLYMVVYDWLKPCSAKIIRHLKINTDALGWKISGGLFTFLLVDYTWLYFRAKSLGEALEIQLKIYREFHLPYVLSDSLLGMFGSYSVLAILLFSLIFLFYTDYLQLQGIDWKKKVLEQQIVYRWTTYILMLLVLFIFGVYGAENGQTQFIYFQF